MRVSMRSMQLAGVLAILTMVSSSAMADSVSDAKAVVEEYSKPNAPWTGPTSGPKAEAGKSVVYVSTDQRNGGALGAGDGVKEAAEKIGWKFTLIDGQGSVAGRTTALGQAVAGEEDVPGLVDAIANGCHGRHPLVDEHAARTHPTSGPRALLGRLRMVGRAHRPLESANPMPGVVPLAAPRRDDDRLERQH